VPRDHYGNEIISPAVRSGTKTQITSQNFCDKRTWYSTSIRRQAQAMTDTGDGMTFALAGGDKVGVDVTHARILHERRIREAHRPVVYVDGVAATEKDPHDDVGDYVVDYLTMRVTFDASRAGSVVTLDFSEVRDSRWYLAPSPGKRLRLAKAELQLSRDGRMRDTFVFQPRADVSKFPPLAAYWDANGGPFPAGAMLPIGEAVYYQSELDLISEANLAYPILQKTALGQGAQLTWRDLPQDMAVYSWDYENQATIDLSSAWGMDIEIRLEHDAPGDGFAAIVTFYCLSENES